jgi:hypothetical protein
MILAMLCAPIGVASATPPIFADDFQSGLDLTRWYQYYTDGGTWIWDSEAGNGFVTSPPQPNIGQDYDRQDKLYTVETDFADFNMTWDLRLRTSGYNQDERGVIFRSQDAGLGNGYWLFICTDPCGPAWGISSGSPDLLFFGPHSWTVDAWYSFRARLVGNHIQVKSWLKDSPEPAGWEIDVMDPSSLFTQGRIAFWDYWSGITDADNVVVTPIGAPACGLSLRDPQVFLNGGELQNYLNGMGETINVYSDQLAAQVCSTSVSGVSTFSLQIELTGSADQNTIGVYDAFKSSPTLYEVFPGQAGPGWIGLVDFLSSGDLVVNVLDNTGTQQSHTVYPGVNTTKIGFYLRGPGGTLFSEDGRNTGKNPQALMYCGSGRNYGDSWLCWDDQPYAGGSDHDFNDAILLLQSLQPVRGLPSTWGRVKAQYR